MSCEVLRSVSCREAPRRADKNSSVGHFLYEPTNEQGVVALFAGLCEEEVPGFGSSRSRRLTRIAPPVANEGGSESSSSLSRATSTIAIYARAIGWSAGSTTTSRAPLATRTRMQELRPFFPELGRQAWIQPYRPSKVDRFSQGKLFDQWTVPSKARKGDLLFVYVSYLRPLAGRKTHEQLFRDEEATYRTALTFLAERFERMLAREDSYGVIVLDSRERAKDDRLRRFFERLRDEGTEFMELDRLVDSLLLGPSHFSIGLQVADLVVGSTVAGRRGQLNDASRWHKLLLERCFARHPEPARSTASA